eukprot:TRINITY_DN7595_c0_g1_i10.p1 TRINITY_DN7595_c0_g1~~TRINITY_DN7595_c0_g1_i10.p1  ORF type:complete len:485 (-),score=104.23 TRINITY_DN7595_c0_g1_i10:1143-2597(-)
MFPKALTTFCNRMIVSIACGASHTILITEMREVFSMGKGQSGALGHGDTKKHRKEPTRIESLNGKEIIYAACGRSHTLVLSATGEIYSFGRGTEGQLGLSDNYDRLVPFKIQSLKSNIRFISCGGNSSACLTQNLELFTWGSNLEGCLGLNLKVTQNQFIPSRVSALPQTAFISCGERHMAALTASNEIFVWGANSCGQLGLRDFNHRLSPQRLHLENYSQVKQIVCGLDHTFILSGEDVWCFGNPAGGKFGVIQKDFISSPILMEGTSGLDVRQIAIGDLHTIILDAKGNIFTSGSNVFGQCGTTEPQEEHVLQQLSGMHGFCAIFAGSFHTCLLLSDPIRLAIEHVKDGNAQVLEPLLSKLAASRDLNTILDEGNDFNMFHWAAYLHHRDVAALLKDRFENMVDVNAYDRYGRTPLHLCAQKGSQQTMAVLLDIPNIDLEKVHQEDNRTALHIAVASGNMECARLLIERGANKRLISIFFWC